MSKRDRIDVSEAAHDAAAAPDSVGTALTAADLRLLDYLAEIALRQALCEAMIPVSEGGPGDDQEQNE